MKLLSIHRLRHHQSPFTTGFSLVEMLVVVGIIAIVAASSLLLLDQSDDRVRYNKTKESYKEIRTALFGPDFNTTLSGNVIVSGYLADMGMLPTSLQDLVTQPLGTPTWRLIASTGEAQAMGARLYHGWRGPYIDVTGGGDVDPWGTPWVYTKSDDSITKVTERYRAGYPTLDPAPIPPNMQLGSLGNDAASGGSEAYAKDFPERSLDNAAVTFTLTNVPIPSRTITLRNNSGTPRTFYIGALYAGLNLSTATFSPGIVGSVKYIDASPSLIRNKTTGAPYTITLGGPDTVIPGSSSSGDKDKDKDKDSSNTVIKATVSATLPSDLTFNLGYARQLQLVLYEASKGGTLLISKLASVDPVIFTYVPKAHTTGGELLSNNAASTTWIVE